MPITYSNALPTPPVISPQSRLSLGMALRGIGGVPASGASPWSDAANSLLAVPFVLEAAETTFYKAWWLNGGTVGNNTEAGIWDANYNKIVTTGSVANAGTASLPQAAAFASSATPTLPPGLYYMGIAHDSTTTGHFFRWSVATVGTALWQGLGCWKQAAITLGSLAATATPASLTNVALPTFGLITRSVFDL